MTIKIPSGTVFSELSTTKLLKQGLLLEALLKKGTTKKNLPIKRDLSALTQFKRKINGELFKRGIHFKVFKQNISQMLPFQIKNPYVIVTGSVFYQAPQDLDFMVFTPLKIDDDYIAKLTVTKLNKFLPSYIHWSNAFYGTPFSTYAPLYTLEVTPKLITRKYAPMYPKTSKGKKLRINLDKIIRELPKTVTVISSFVYYAPAQHLFLIPRLSIFYHVPLFIRLQRMFPPDNRPKVQTFLSKVPQGSIPVYSLTLNKTVSKVVEM